MNENSRTDWARVDALGDDDIDTSDSPQLTEEFFERARWRTPALTPLQVIVTIDSDTMEWFQEQGAEARQQMTAALRIYAEAHKNALRRKTA